MDILVHYSRASWHGRADKTVVGQRTRDKKDGIIYHHLLAIKDGKDNAHEMDNNDGRMAAQVARLLSVITRLDNCRNSCKIMTTVQAQ